MYGKIERKGDAYSDKSQTLVLIEDAKSSNKRASKRNEEAISKCLSIIIASLKYPELILKHSKPTECVSLENVWRIDLFTDSYNARKRKFSGQNSKRAHQFIEIAPTIY